eukprot:scaffold84106_cov75-Phaeocystis_antarctica.AAC.8
MVSFTGAPSCSTMETSSQLRPDDLGRLDLPELRAVERLRHETIRALLDRGLHRHRKDRRPVLRAVGYAGVDGIQRDEWPGGVVDGDDSALLRNRLEAIPRRVLPLLARVSELHAGVASGRSGNKVHGPELLSDDDHQGGQLLHTEQQVDAVLEHGLAAKLEELLRPVRLHARPGATRKEHDGHIFTRRHIGHARRDHTAAASRREAQSACGDEERERGERERSHRTQLRFSGFVVWFYTHPRRS